MPHEGAQEYKSMKVYRVNYFLLKSLDNPMALTSIFTDVRVPQKIRTKKIVLVINLSYFYIQINSNHI